jgi:hypothetical protein
MSDLEGLTKSAPPQTDAHATKGLARSLVRVALAVWFIVMLSVGASLLARHVVALPRPTIDPALATAMASLRTQDDAGRWMVVHVRYAECRCSQRIAEHLLSAPRPSDTTEEVLLVGHEPDLEARLAAHSYRVLSVTPKELGERFHIVAAPSFIVAAPDGSVRYAGGYAATKQGPDPRDRSILADLRIGKSVAALPVFGCAVSEKLQAELNPLGIP